jgi:hypothetical protein
MRSSARKPARARVKTDAPADAPAPAQAAAPALAQAEDSAEPELADAAAAPQKRNGARSGRGRKPRAGANGE